jgi:hypothetical protein
MKKLTLISLAVAAALMSGAVASAQVSNGIFAPPPISTGVGWGTNSGPSPSYSGFGPGATVDWNLGGQYAYDPVSTDFGWTFNGGAGVQQNGSAWGFTAPPIGNQSAFIQDYNGYYYYNGGFVPVGTVASPSSISQTLTGLTVGDSYVLSFYMEERSYNVGGYAPIVVSIGSSSSAQTAPASTYSWQLYDTTFTASGTSETLSFSSPFPPGLSPGHDLDTGIADVSISAGSTPPSGGGIPISLPEGGASWLYLLLAGATTFGAIFFRSRNRFANLASA